jgi:phage terminase large subunit-like protein
MIDTRQLLKALEHRIKQRKVYLHLPYGHPDTLCPDGALWKEKHASGDWDSWSNKPWQLDFHNAGKDHRERMLICANRVGKSESGGYEAAIHMTGEYPDWWDGKRFDKPVLLWTGSPTNETSRDIIQKALLGGTSKEELGTGFIPREKIVGKPRMRQAGVSDVVDTFKVRHKSGGVSTCVAKTYEQGWRKWQGTEPEVVWLDEEPEDYKVYTEALTRLLTSHGIMMVTFTPLLGQTDLVLQFQGSESDQVWVGTATWDDAPHLNREERKSMMESYPDHELQARTMGVPMMGEGRIFTTNEDEIIVDPFHIPAHWAKINGIDFGIDHPFGLGCIAWDRDRDIIYIYHTHKEKDGNIPQQAAQIKKFGQWIPVSWPHDGLKRIQGERNAGHELHKFYRKEGVNMLSRSARYENDTGGSQAQWPVIEEVKERERTGRIKVTSNCVEYLEERRNYHTKDGKIVAKRDDVLKAVFYAIMMKRYANTGHGHNQRPPQQPVMTTRI